MAGVVEGFRWSLWEYSDFDLRYFIGISISLLMLCVGVLFFKKMENEVADIL